MFYTGQHDRFELDEDIFFELFPKRPADAHKGSTGRVLLVSGSYGMAGAACLNILGAKALGAPYITVALPAQIYPVAAAHNVTPVFYPYQPGNGRYAVRDALGRAASAAFGSGSDNNQDIDDIFLLLLCSDVPLVLDAAALRLLNSKKQIIKERTAPVIITPHRGEFSALYPQGDILLEEDPVKAASDCARELGVMTVLKGPNTIVASPEGRIYVNRTGNQGLAQAGSGDVLTGMTAAMLSFVKDPFEAACMAVFAHGMAADRLAKTHALQTLPLEKIPEAMDGLFFEHGF